jgi:hypothetical protein
MLHRLALIMRSAKFLGAALFASAISVATLAAHSADNDLDARFRAIDARILKIARER